MGDELLGSIILVFLFGPPLVVGYGLGSWRRGRKERARTNLAISNSQLADSTIEQIRHDAYEQMAVDPTATLPPIVVDVIREYDKERKKGLKALGTAAPVYEPDQSAGRPFVQLNGASTYPPAQQAPQYPPTHRDG